MGASFRDSWAAAGGRVWVPHTGGGGHHREWGHVPCGFLDNACCDFLLNRCIMGSECSRSHGPTKFGLPSYAPLPRFRYAELFRLPGPHGVLLALHDFKCPVCAAVRKWFHYARALHLRWARVPPPSSEANRTVFCAVCLDCVARGHAPSDPDAPPAPEAAVGAAPAPAGHLADTSPPPPPAMSPWEATRVAHLAPPPGPPSQDLALVNHPPDDSRGRATPLDYGGASSSSLGAAPRGPLEPVRVAGPSGQGATPPQLTPTHAAGGVDLGSLEGFWVHEANGRRSALERGVHPPDGRPIGPRLRSHRAADRRRRLPRHVGRRPARVAALGRR